MKAVKNDGARRPPLSPVRQAMHAAMIEAAGRRFLEVGYARTTMEAIAAEAGVSVQTLYNSVGNKAAFLTAVFEQRVSGPHGPRPVPEFMKERAARASDASGVLRVLAEWLVEVHTRMAPTWRMVDEAAAQDEEVAAFARKRAHKRLANYQRAAEELGKRRGVRKGMGVEETAALIWSIGHPLVHRTLVLELKWPTSRYQEWLESSLRAALLR